MRIQPYLCFNGYEILNDLRTYSYMRRGLVDSRWTAQLRADALPEGSGYVDTYTDVYELDPFSPYNLAGYCHAIDGSALTASGAYESPADDDAPWYQATRPESGDFMGLALLDAQLPSVLSRAVDPRGTVGATAGRLYTGKRLVQVSALMFASSDRGMAWGERWLTEALAGDLCDQVTDLGELLLLPSCPPIGDEDRYFRTLKRAGLVDGPSWQQLRSNSSIPECNAQQVDFQIVSELPWLYAPPAVIGSGTVTSDAPVSGLAVTEPWLGDAAVRVTLTATTDFVGRLTLAPVTEDTPCPNEGAVVIDFQIRLDEGDHFSFDSAAREVTMQDWTSKAVVSGLNRLDFVGPFQWLDVPPCSRVCVMMAGLSGSATAVIEQLDREL